jgi:hypothetical protein
VADNPSRESGNEIADKAKHPVSRCITCREKIERGAKICIRCNQFQDWRRFFGLSSTILSLLVALVSVLSIAIPAVLNVRPPQKSDIHCSLLEWNAEGGNFKLAVSNKGNRAAVVKGPMLARKQTERDKPADRDQKETSKRPASTESNSAIAENKLPLFHPEKDDWDQVLEPQSYRVLMFWADVGGSRNLASIDEVRQHYSLRVLVFPFESSTGTEIPCDNWETFNEMSSP